jgi:hypothetical protein
MLMEIARKRADQRLIQTADDCASHGFRFTANGKDRTIVFVKVEGAP